MYRQTGFCDIDSSAYLYHRMDLMDRGKTDP
jgi:hypothetical protein